MTRWPRYLGPGYLAVYALGLLLWLAIYELWGAVVVVVLVAAGVLGIVVAANLLMTGYAMPPEERR